MRLQWSALLAVLFLVVTIRSASCFFMGSMTSATTTATAVKLWKAKLAIPLLQRGGGGSVRRGSTTLGTTADADAAASSGHTSASSKAPIPTLAKWDPTQAVWLTPAAHNATPFRLTCIVAAVVAMARGSLFVPGRLSKFVHLLAFACWMGTTLWTTFIAGITMYKTLPRQMFGKVQSRLFPAYFALNTACVGVMFATLGSPLANLQTRAGVCLVAAFLSNLLNMVVLEPKSTDVMYKRYAIENEGDQTSDEYKSLAKAFGKLHGMSSLANLVAVVAGFAYAWSFAMVLPS